MSQIDTFRDIIGTGPVDTLAEPGNSIVFLFWSDADPMPYTLGQAAKATGKSKNTLTRAIRSGKLSGQRQADGSYTIDPAELHRVYPPVSEAGVAGHPMDPVTLQAQCQLLEREREVLLATLADLRQRLDAADSERRTAQERLTALLTHQTEKQQNIPPEPRSSLLEKLFGRRW
jgi:hypothetical protein